MQYSNKTKSNAIILNNATKMQYNNIKNNATIIKQKANQCNKTKQCNKNAMQ